MGLRRNCYCCTIRKCSIVGRGWRKGAFELSRIGGEGTFFYALFGITDRSSLPLDGRQLMESCFLFFVFVSFDIFLISGLAYCHSWLLASRWHMVISILCWGIVELELFQDKLKTRSKSQFNFRCWYIKLGMTETQKWYIENLCLVSLAKVSKYWAFTHALSLAQHMHHRSNALAFPSHLNNLPSISISIDLSKMLIFILLHNEIPPLLTTNSCY